MAPIAENIDLCLILFHDSVIHLNSYITVQYTILYTKYTENVNSTNRHGTEFIEVWQDGVAFKDIKKRLEQNEVQRNEIEKTKKQLSKKRTNLTKSDNKSEGEVTPEIAEIMEQEELLKLKLAYLKKQETDMQTERERLLLEKSLHIRELKRITDEDHSKFNTSPLLRDRYLLMSMLGRGGFSEVYKVSCDFDTCHRV